MKSFPPSALDFLGALKWKVAAQAARAAEWRAALSTLESEPSIVVCRQQPLLPSASAERTNAYTLGNLKKSLNVPQHLPLSSGEVPLDAFWHVLHSVPQHGHATTESTERVHCAARAR